MASLPAVMSGPPRPGPSTFVHRLGNKFLCADSRLSGCHVARCRMQLCPKLVVRRAKQAAAGRPFVPAPCASAAAALSPQPADFPRQA